MAQEQAAAHDVFESTRAAEPADFPAILWGCLHSLSDVTTAPFGSRVRHDILWNLELLLKPQIEIDASNGGGYKKSKLEAAKLRDAIRADKMKGISASEHERFFQALWQEALMVVLKRRNLLGEDWSRG